MADLSQSVECFSFDPGRLLEALCPEKPPIFVSTDTAQHQLRRIADAVEAAGCASVAFERHYIDRDYMEDHSVFYSRSLYPYNNYCKRAHFFNLGEGELTRELDRLLRLGLSTGVDEFRTACSDFSKEHYLGFSVVKPLSGSPVGRTVIRPPQGESSDQLVLSCRSYRIHLAGLELKVFGLAFQQQDIGVSACATTAIWSSLQISREFEEIASATPAQITALASRYALPFGRAMPQEGLSIDQMCQAIQACGASPALNRVVDQFPLARSLVCSAVRSGLAPILIITNPSKNRSHAVTVCGATFNLAPTTLTAGSRPTFRETAEDLCELLVHDDRHGPYLRAKLHVGANKSVQFSYTPGQVHEIEPWALSYVLAALHGKVRLWFGNLRVLMLKIVEDCLVELTNYLSRSDILVSVDTRITRPHSYIEAFFGSDPAPDHDAIVRLATNVCFPRYLAVVTLVGADFGQIDVLIDTTSTERNVHCLAVAVPRQVTPTSSLLANALSKKYGCPVIGSVSALASP